ncbi:hypothetical protein [Cohnella soli]|uniref:YtxH domain-containing protein n=1 Tax=Cohnella soli TaxID=425005 RepID=A0ABW0HUE5_9BACL
MKLGTFIIGGLAGAAVVMMVRRNRMMSAVAANVGGQLRQRMSDMKDDAIEKALNMKFASSFKRAASKAERMTEGVMHEMHDQNTDHRF